MRKKSIDGLPYEHMSTNAKIYQSVICRLCPYRIYSNDSEKVTFGIGNIFGDYIFIVPSYDTKAKVGTETTLTLLAKTFNEITGKNMFEEAYITRLVKCQKNLDHSLYEQAVTPCSNYLVKEINRLAAKNIIFFGTTYNDYMNNRDIVGLNIPLKNIFKSLNPDIFFYDNNILKKRFIDNLTHILLNY